MATGGTQFLFRKMEQTICLIVASALWLHAKRKVAPVAPFWSDEARIRKEPLSSGLRVRACLPPRDTLINSASAQQPFDNSMG